MRDTIDMAQEIAAQYIKAERFQTWTHEYMMERLMELVAVSAAAEREKYKWDIHSCGPTCQRYACVAIREAVEAEREACAKVCDAFEVPAQIEGAHPDYLIGKEMAASQLAAAIRNRGNT